MENDKWISWVKASAVILILGFVIFLTGSCSRGGGSPTQIGVFKDTVVCGLGYSTIPGELSGTTSAQGEFYFKKGDKVTFFIGNIEIASVMAKSSLSPQDLVPGGADIEGPAVRNVARFFQSLDVDSAENTIELPAGLTDVVNSWLIIQAGSPFGFDLDDDEFEFMAQDLMDYLDAQMAVYSGGVELMDEKDVAT